MTAIDDPTPAPTPAEPSGLLNRLADSFVQAAPALVGAISLAGFVAVVGGAISWVRFNAAELPADQAVRVMPRQELVTIGAVSLVGFVLLGLLTVFVVWMLDHNGNLTESTRRGIVALAVIEMAVAISYSHLPLGVIVLLAIWLALLAALGWAALAGLTDTTRKAQVTRDERETLRNARDRYRRADDALQDAELDRRCWDEHARDHPAAAAEADARHAAARSARQVANQRYTRTFKCVYAAVEGKPGENVDLDSEEFREDAVEELLRPGSKLPNPDLTLPNRNELARARRDAAAALRTWRDKLLGNVVPLVMVVCAAAGIVALLWFPETTWLAQMVLVTTGLAIALLVISRTTKRFAWYGLAVFFSVLIFGGVLSVARFVRTPEVQPAALIRTADKFPVCGVYITETADRIYLGRVELEGPGHVGAKADSGRIWWVPTKDVDVLKVGSLQSIESAQSSAEQLRRELYIDRVETHPEPLAPEATVDTRGAPGGLSTEVKSQRPAEQVLPRRSYKPPLPKHCSSVHVPG